MTEDAIFLGPCLDCPADGSFCTSCGSGPQHRPSLSPNEQPGAIKTTCHNVLCVHHPKHGEDVSFPVNFIPGETISSQAEAEVDCLLPEGPAYSELKNPPDAYPHKTTALGSNGTACSGFALDGLIVIGYCANERQPAEQ